MEPWTIQEAMKELKVCRATIYNLVKRGLLTKHKSKRGYGRGGRRVWFDADEVRILDPEWNQTQVLALINSGEPILGDDLLDAESCAC